MSPKWPRSGISLVMITLLIGRLTEELEARIYKDTHAPRVEACEGAIGFASCKEKQEINLLVDRMKELTA